MRFANRRDAGRQLAKRLLPLKNQQPVVLALPRGGVPVGLEIANALAAPLDLVLVRKIGVPYQEELAVGAVADGEHPELVIDHHLMHALAISEEYLDEAQSAALQEIGRRRRVYLGDRPAVEIAGCTAILVDDGIATGSTMLAALRATRRRAPARLVVAVPVAPLRTLQRLQRVADETVCLDTPAEFYAVGQAYWEFPQLRDDEVVSLLHEAQANLKEPNGSRR